MRPKEYKFQRRVRAVLIKGARHLPPTCPNTGGCLLSSIHARRFPPPWTLDEANAACFIVRDKNCQALAYVYFADEPGRQTAAKLLSEDEARRIAANIAKPYQSLLRGVVDVRASPSVDIITRQVGVRLKTRPRG